MATQQLTAPRFAVSGVPVFMYHDLSAVAAVRDRYAVSAQVFREHLAFLRERQFSVRQVSELTEECAGNSAVLTFDDGLASHYELATPALLESGFSAAFFVSTALVGSSGYLSWSQLREMSAAGMTIGSHGHRHIDYTGLNAATAQRELLHSRLELEEQLGIQATTFSAPYGFLNGQLTAAARSAGFQCICSSHPWTAKRGDAITSRIAIYNDTTVERFFALALRSAWPLLARRVRNAALHLPKQILLRTSPRSLGVHVGAE